jgi:hypothetical protein
MELSVPLFARVGNFARAVVRHAADGFAQVCPEEYEARLAACRSCELLDQRKMVCGHPRCGCFVVVKASWASERCPAGRWALPLSSEKPEAGASGCGCSKPAEPVS